MLSDRNVREINDQIASELRTVGRYTPSAEEKDQALARIAKLKALLDDDPTPTPAVPVDANSYTLEDLGHDVRELARAFKRNR